MLGFLLQSSALATPCVPTVYHFLPIDQGVPTDTRALTDFDGCGRDVDVLLNNAYQYTITDDSPAIIRVDLPPLTPSSNYVVQLVMSDDGSTLFGRGSTLFTTGTAPAAPAGTPDLFDVIAQYEVIDEASQQYSPRVVWRLLPSAQQDQTTVLDVEVAFDGAFVIPFGGVLEQASWNADNFGDETFETLGEPPASEACVQALEENGAGVRGTPIEVCVDVTLAAGTNPTGPTGDDDDDDDDTTTTDAPATDTGEPVYPEKKGCGCEGVQAAPVAERLLQLVSRKTRR